MRISILGPLRVQRGETEVDVAGVKQQTVLAALVVARANVVSTDRLVELIWGSRPPAKPYENLRAYVSHLRRLLEPERPAGRRSGLLVTRSPGYALDVDADVVDAFEFESRLATAQELVAANRYQAAHDEVSSALHLWRSDDLDDSPLVHFVAERERLLELRQSARTLQFECRLAAGQHVECIPDLRLLVDEDPLRERPRALLMLALHRAQRSAEALEVYQAGYRASVEATGLDPAPTLKELEAGILANDPGLDWVAAGAAPPADVVGRTVEARVIGEALAQPGGDLVVVTGEAGIGKTHLLEYAAERADRSMSVAWGVGHEGNRSLTLGPWRSILQRLMALVDDETLASVGERSLAQLAVLLPELEGRTGSPRDPSQGEGALHNAVVTLLDRLLRRSPVLLCCDDVHWYDPSSIRLLSTVVTAARGRPLVVVAAWRDTERLSDEMSSALGVLAGLGGRRRLALSGLGPDAVAHLWAETLGHTPSPDAVERLHRRTGGNALFVTELLRARSRSDASTPTATMHELIMGQVTNLTPAGQELLTVCAFCADGATERLLSRVTGIDGPALDEQVAALLDSGLAAESAQPFPALVVRHSVIAEVVVARLSASAQARYHQRIAEALRRRHVPAGRLAHHFLGGGPATEPESAATAALEAARYSAGLHDHAGSIDLIERGLVALGQSDDDLLRSELLVLLAQERKHLEHFAQAHTAAEEAFRLARRGGDVDLMVAAALVYCGQNIEEIHYGSQWLGYWHPPGPALEMLAECLEKLEPGSTRVAVEVAYASQLFGVHHDRELARSILDDAVASARDLDEPGLLSSLLHYRMTALQRELSLDERLASVTEGLALVDAGESPHREIVARRDLLVLHLDRGDLTAAQDELERCRAVAGRTDDQTMAMLVASMHTSLALYRGNLAEVGDGIAQAVATYERLGSAALDLFGIQYSALLREQGHHDQVIDLLTWKLSGYPGPAYAMPLAVVLAEAGRRDEALQLLEQYRAPWPVLAGEAVLQFSTLAFAADLAALVDDTELAADLYRGLQPAAGRTVSMFSGLALYGSGSLYLGRLATVLSRWDEARDHLDRAETDLRALGARPYLLRTLLARGRLDIASGVGVDRARQAEVELLAAELGMEWLTAVPVAGG